MESYWGCGKFFIVTLKSVVQDNQCQVTMHYSHAPLMGMHWRVTYSAVHTYNILHLVTIYYIYLQSIILLECYTGFQHCMGV